MKKILLIIILILLGGLFLQTKAQPCTIANPAIKLNYSIVEGNNCKIGIDLYFDMIHNSGGKFVWVHIWSVDNYSNYSYANQTPPTVANGGLLGSVATAGALHKGGGLEVQTSYLPDPSAPNFQFLGVKIDEGPGILPGSERYSFKNLVLTVPGGCNVTQSFYADIWQSQDANSANIACVYRQLLFIANDPKVNGLLYCVAPRKYSFTIETITTTGSLDVDYEVYIDDGDGIFNVATDIIRVNNGTVTLSSANSYKYLSGQLEYLPYSNQKPYGDRDLWVVISSPTLPNAVYAHLVNMCIPLPVKLTSFTAMRTSDRVKLSWTTASEINNQGFYIMRQNGNNGWQVMGYIPSAAPNGNSDAAINYSFTDMNKLGGVTQYRLQQVDFDNAITYSDIRMVKGMDQTGRLLVFPNPSPDGNLNIVLDNMGTDLNVRLIDMNGRLVKEWNNVTNGKIFVSQVASGMYTLRVWERNTGQVQQLKVIVSK